MACLFPSTQLSYTVLGIDLAAAMMNAETRHTHRKAWIGYSACLMEMQKQQLGTQHVYFTSLDWRSPFTVII